MTPRIVDLDARHIVGVWGRMSPAEDDTPRLWRTFMPRRGEVRHRADDLYLSVRIYDTLDPRMFEPDTLVEKWAAVAVDEVDEVPAGMDRHRLRGGRYAVFVHEGPASTFAETMRFIFATWLPASGYQLDQREHFEVLTEDYDPTSPNAREEVWVPIK